MKKNTNSGGNLLVWFGFFKVIALGQKDNIFVFFCEFSVFSEIWVF